MDIHFLNSLLDDDGPSKPALGAVSADARALIDDLFGDDDDAPALGQQSPQSEALINELMGDVREQAPHGEGASSTERSRKRRDKIRARKISNIAVLDFETDPFDNVRKTDVFPFLAVLYSDNFEPVIIWDEEAEAFISKVIATIEALPEAYTIYAHNGGKFDYMFLLKRLRGQVMFKGRGIMSATIGKHELRDSFHIIPDKLANFKKDHIDYKLMKRATREQYKQAIIDYCVSDCRYLLEIVKAFAAEFGLKISIGQAAMAELRKHHKFECVSERTDEMLRAFFFGGRVECLKGLGHFKGDYKLIDVNSMYPSVMADREHPIGAQYFAHTSEPNENTFFIELTCNSRGAFVMKNDQETFAPHGRHRFHTTIWEYRVALKHGLISDIEIHRCIDCLQKSNFAKFIVPMYERRQTIKGKLKALKYEGFETGQEYNELVKEDMFMKFLLNNAYGKFAQNPRRYKEHLITEPFAKPEDETFGEFPKVVTDDYWLWEKPNPEYKFNNVGTGASITGAARSVLLDAICQSEGAVYCDTDSLICLNVSGIEMHPTKLGAWDTEKEISEVIVNGKKLYTYQEKKTEKIFVKSKGAANVLSVEQLEFLDGVADDEQEKEIKRLSWENMIHLNNGGEIVTRSKGVTLQKDGSQYYMERRIRATATQHDG